MLCANCISEKYRFMSACAVRAGWRGPKIFEILEFSVCQWIILRHDSVSCLIKWIFYGSITRWWLAWCYKSIRCIEPTFARGQLIGWNSFCGIRRRQCHSGGICRRQSHSESHTAFRKLCIVFCVKPKEVDPIKLISLRQINVSKALKYTINNSVKIYRIRALMIATLSFFFIIENIYITSISFYWRNDTPNILSSSLNQFVPEIVSPLPCSSEFVRHTLLFVYFVVFAYCQ